MATDKYKENIKNERRTRIPLPQKPLPPLPTHLIKTSLKNRHPLKTLNTVENTSNVRTTSKLLSKTLKFREESSDCTNKVFQDLDKKLKTSDTDDKENQEPSSCKYNAGVPECKLVCLDDSVRPKTPFAGVAEPLRIRKIKRSLKRPHSRELQGRASPTELKLEASSNVKQNEGGRIVDRLKLPDELTTQYVKMLTSYSGNIFQNLMENEKKLLTCSMLSDVTRTCLVNWILKINGEDGDPATSQTACWFLDSFSSICIVKVDSLQVMSAACYWLAQKMKGPNITASRLVKNGGYSYNSSSLISAEMKIFKYLKFPSQPIVPHDFTTYLSWWCDHKNPGPIEVASSFIALCGMLIDKTLACQYPSVIGCAAVFNAITLLQKKELIPRLLSSDIYAKANRKTSDFNAVCKALRQAVITVGSPTGEYRSPYEHYSRPPLNIAKIILKAATSYENKHRAGKET